MKLSIFALLTCIFLSVSGSHTHAASKPAPQSTSVKDLALREARTYDANHNGRIDGSEKDALRQAWKANPKSYLYLFDENSNQYLEDSEISKIELDGGSKKSASAAKKPEPKKKKK
jgi:hypothetical protein